MIKTVTLACLQLILLIVLFLGVTSWNKRDSDFGEDY